MPSRSAPDLKMQEVVTGLCLRKEHHVQPEHSLRLPVSFLFKKDLLLFILCILYCCKVSPPKTTQILLKSRRQSLLPASGCVGNLSKSCSPEPCSPFVCKTQAPLPGCHTAVSKKQKRQVSTVRDFPGTTYQVFDGQVFVPVLAGMGAYVLGFEVKIVPLTWCQLC